MAEAEGGGEGEKASRAMEEKSQRLEEMKNRRRKREAGPPRLGSNKPGHERLRLGRWHWPCPRRRLPWDSRPGKNRRKEEEKERNHPPYQNKETKTRQINEKNPSNRRRKRGNGRRGEARGEERSGEEWSGAEWSGNQQ